MKQAPRALSIVPLGGIGEVRPGDSLVTILADALSEAGLAIEAGDILVVTSKIMSKAEGRFVDLREVTVSERAAELAEQTHKDPRLVELVLAESTHIVRAVPHVLITRHRLGLVMANAGIDQSNLGPDGNDHVLLLPQSPDQSAAVLRAGLADAMGQAPAIIISDSFGRPWRHGVVNVGIGASGLPALVDRRGEADRDGRILEVTQVALADMIATAAGLVTGEGGEGVPAALVRGYPLPAGECPASAIVRPPAQDLFA